MISKISLFNKGIYRSTVRRFLWGSALYFILLFIMTSLAILLSVDKASVPWSINGETQPLILDSSFIILPIIAAMAVPTVVALLVFRFVHSKKQAVFVHGLPVSRTSNFISSVLAGFTLMGLPVILNGIILMIISASGYSEYFGISFCFIWIGINLLCLFVMFAFAGFTAMITGNSFAMVALNVLIHIFLLVISGAFGIVADKFLYGYAGANVLFRFFADKLPAAWIVNNMMHWQGIRNISVIEVICYILLSFVFYILSLAVYKARRMETAEDVAGFRCLNPIFKYLLTSLAALGTFAVFAEFVNKNAGLLIFLIILISLVVYVACEMILKKTVKVWRSYKGYLGFLAVSAVSTYIFVFTGFFGFESFVPNSDDVKNIAVYEYYYRDKEPFVGDTDIKEYALEKHEEFIGQAHTLNDWLANETNCANTYVNFVYNMNNGDVIKRRYPVTFGGRTAIMNTLYENKEYKQKCDGFFPDNMKEIINMNINGGIKTVTDPVQLNTLYENIRKDILELDYDRMFMYYGDFWGFDVEFGYKCENKTSDAEMEGQQNYDMVRYMSRTINANYKHTIKWLKDNGYWDAVARDIDNDLYIYKKAESYSCRAELANIQAEQAAKETADTDEFDYESYIKINEEDKAALLDYIYSMDVKEPKPNESFYTIYFSNGADLKTTRSTLTVIPEENLPELLKKYLNN